MAGCVSEWLSGWVDVQREAAALGVCVRVRFAFFVVIVVVVAVRGARGKAISARGSPASHRSSNVLVWWSEEM